LFNLEDNLLLFFTGFARSSGSILKDQHQRSVQHDSAMIKNLHYVKELGLPRKKYLEKGKTGEFGALMHEHWEQKEEALREHDQCNYRRVVRAWAKARAIGGKLVGGGGGGFLMFYAEDRNRLRQAMARANLEEVPLPIRLRRYQDYGVMTLSLSSSSLAAWRRAFAR
jgi:D-glycero-alpha-D-manno-heptose-7-phosphate kinase